MSDEIVKSKNVTASPVEAAPVAPVAPPRKRVQIVSRRQQKLPITLMTEGGKTRYVELMPQTPIVVDVPEGGLGPDFDVKKKRKFILVSVVTGQ